ncbi:MAG: hypothetical protein QM820_53050 [Minicystis sp.]
MIDLPRDLAPWRPLLDLFAPDLAEGLGRLVPRLALAIGPMRIARPTGDGEPDGFTGIARRGSYERLLLTEWLLADEFPDEFIRRAAGGEHAFFQLARRSPARASSSVVLFDAGPDQLGAPRIAHLAALIVLAARAERARARFAWGLLHRPHEHLLTEVTAQSVTRLLAARSALPPVADDVAAWAERARGAGWEDAWIVGGQTIWPGWRHATLQVRDVLDPARRVLAVSARAPGAPPREVELDLPPDPAAARLLRDPFAVAVAAPQPSPRVGGVAPISNLVFAANGTKVFARSAAGDIIAYPVPNSPNAPAGRPKRYRPRGGGVVAAVGWVMRGLVMLVIKEREIVLEHTHHDAPLSLRQRIAVGGEQRPVPAQIADALAPLAYRDDREVEISFTDARRTLFRVFRPRILDEVDGTPLEQVERMAEEVSAMVSFGDRFAFVGRGLPAEEKDPTAPLSPIWHFVMHGWPDANLHHVHLDGSGTFEACFGIVENGAPRGLVAVQQRGERWTILDNGRPVDDRLVPEDLRVIGPWWRARTGAPDLVVLRPDQRTIAVLGQSDNHTLPRAAAPITDVVLSPARAQLAYVTTAGEVVILSLQHDVPLARFLPGSPR